jgi:hypothetical protein
VDRRGIEGWEKYEPLAGACIREAERLFALRGAAQASPDRGAIKRVLRENIAKYTYDTWEGIYAREDVDPLIDLLLAALPTSPTAPRYLPSSDIALARFPGVDQEHLRRAFVEGMCAQYLATQSSPPPVEPSPQGDAEDLAELLRRVSHGSMDAWVEIIAMFNERRKELVAARSSARSAPQPASNAETEDLSKANKLLHALLSNRDAEIERLHGAAYAEKEPERLRKGIQDYLDGNYPHARKLRAEQGPHAKCSHGRPYWEACDSCIDEHFTKLLAGPSVSSTQREGEA